jgi:hypothetical protein
MCNTDRRFEHPGGVLAINRLTEETSMMFQRAASGDQPPSTNDGAPKRRVVSRPFKVGAVLLVAGVAVAAPMVAAQSDGSDPAPGGAEAIGRQAAQVASTEAETVQDAAARAAQAKREALAAEEAEAAAAKEAAEKAEAEEAAKEEAFEAALLESQKEDAFREAAAAHEAEVARQQQAAREQAAREAAARAAAANAAAPAVAQGSVWDALARCEAGGNWSINTGNGYYGGLQFSASSWRAVGGTGLPHQHSRETQIAMGERLRAAQGWGAWPSCSRKLGLR